MPFGKKESRDGESKAAFGHLKVLQALGPYEFGVELWVMRQGINRNKWDYRNLRECYQTFLGQPILCAFPNGKIGDGHNTQEKMDLQTGETYYSFTDGRSERIVGTLSDDSKDLTLRERDGELWLVAKGRLFAFYARELVDKIVRQGVMEVSAETDILEQRREGDIEVFTRWAGLGVTILGDGVAPAIPGAKIKRMAAMRAELQEVKLQAAALAQENQQQADKNQKQEKGVRETMKLLSKKQLAEIAPKFAPCTVVAAAQMEKGIRVCLLSETGATLIYDWADPEDEIRLAKAQQVEVNARFPIGEEEFAEAEVSELYDSLYVKLNTASQELENTRRTLSEREQELEGMRQAESARRLTAAKKSAEDTLAAFNANRAEALPRETIQEVLDRVEKGGFAACMSEDGQWTGEAAVREAVLARCGQAVMEQDQQAAEKNRQTYIWNTAGTSGGQEDGTIDGQIKKWLAQN